MRIWHPIPVMCLDNKRLLGEHVEIHTIFNVITKNKQGYSNHPETNRWRGHLSALKHRHDLIVNEMYTRGYNHKSPIHYTTLNIIYPDVIEPISTMRNKLTNKLSGK